MVSLTVMPVAPVSTSMVAGMVSIETATYAPPLLNVIGTLSIVDEVGAGTMMVTAGAGAGVDATTGADALAREQLASLRVTTVSPSARSCNVSV